MLTLNPGSTCDVCAEEYGPHCLPHSIPCGHVLCATCCTTIAEKSAPRCAPVCPFCREPFSPADARVVRTDFASSGWTTPRRVPAMDAAADLAGALLAKKAERLLSAPGPKTRAEARKLEHKVARVAAKKCSVEEVTVLYKELQEWLTADTQQDEQSASLHLSAALLRAILINHIAHSEASKAAKMVEANLKDRIDDLEKTNKKLDAELHHMKQNYNYKAQECSTLRTELSRLKAVASTLGGPPAPPSSSAPSSTPTSPTSPPPTPTAYNSPSTPSPLSRYGSVHSHTRSVSMSVSRSTTPAPSARSHTPSIRSYTPAPAPSMRSPTPSLRSSTPAPRSATPASTHHRSHTPAPPVPMAPPVPHKPRRLSHSGPQKMVRSASDEKREQTQQQYGQYGQQQERWVPTQQEPYGKPARPPSRLAAYTSSAAARFREMRTPSPT